MPDRPLPDTSAWRPNHRASETLQDAFQKRCAGIEEMVRTRARLEREVNVHNFDSGSGVEEIVREQLGYLLPRRYTVTAGVVNDRNGLTAGDVDVVVFNDFWFPWVKFGATPASRRVHFPIEGIYAVCEVKQSIGLETLDNAMQKLVMCQRLERPRTSPHRTSENRDGNSCEAGMTNPLYSAVIGVELSSGTAMSEIVERFVRINQQLKRTEVVRALCILGQGTVTWGFMDEERQVRPARFSGWDLALPVSPLLHLVPPHTSALYPFVLDLNLHLFDTILAPEDIAAHYGAGEFQARVAAQSKDMLQPEPEWVGRFSPGTTATSPHVHSRGEMGE